MIAAALLTAVMANIGWWFYVTTQHETFYEMLTAYLDVFPDWLQNARIITVIDIFFLGVSGFIFMEAAKANYLKILSIVLVGLSALLLLWQVWTLM
jgi:hypothetical protein